MKVPKAYHLPQHYSIVSCQSCGMVYADTAASMEDYDYYYTHCNFYGDDSKDDNSFRYEMMEEILGCFCQKDTAMLEIGAGNGRFEIALKEHGYTNITGTDPSSESVERLRAAGIRAHISNIYSPVSQMEKGKYGCVFLFEVAEHLLVPGKAIGNVKEMLKEDGIFMVSVPDYSLIAKETKYGIPAYFNLEHINYFSETSLDSLMDAYGMERVYPKKGRRGFNPLLPEQRGKQGSRKGHGYPEGGTGFFGSVPGEKPENCTNNFGIKRSRPGSCGMGDRSLQHEPCGRNRFVGVQDTGIYRQ